MIGKATFSAVLFVSFAGTVLAQSHQHGSLAASEAHTTRQAEVKRHSAPLEFRSQLDSLYTVSFTIQGALSRDSLVEAKKSAARFQTTLKSVDMLLLTGDAHTRWMQLDEALDSAATALSSARNIAAARLAFRDISNTLIPVLDEFGTSGSLTVYVLHCPMAFNNTGADWLQSHPKVENPWFGKSMFACGQVKKIHERAKNGS